MTIADAVDQFLDARKLSMELENERLKRAKHWEADAIGHKVRTSGETLTGAAEGLPFEEGRRELDAFINEQPPAEDQLVLTTIGNAFRMRENTKPPNRREFSFINLSPKL